MLAFLVLLSFGAAQPAEDPFVVSASSPAAAAEQASAPEAQEATEATTSAEPSRQRLICRSRPVLGSRVVGQRTCRTAEEWAIYENDLEQSRRDIADRGARGCNPSAPNCIATGNSGGPW